MKLNEQFLSQVLDFLMDKLDFFMKLQEKKEKSMKKWGELNRDLLGVSPEC